MRRPVVRALPLLALGGCALRVSGRGGGSDAVGAIVFFVLLWTLVPFLVAVKMGGDRGQLGLAVLLTLALGWLGLAIFYFLTKDDARRQVADAVRRVAPAPPLPPVSPTHEERLTQLEMLRAKKLITEQEYKTRRQAILREL